MATPNMSTITDSLERDLQNFSLKNDHHPRNSNCSSSSSNDGGNVGAGEISSSDLIKNHHHDDDTSETAYELNSHIRMPYHWEQCLDLKTGELYYINWRTGMKSKEDPRTTSQSSNPNVGFNLSSVELNDESSYESEGSTTEESSSSPSTTTSDHKKGSTIENNNNCENSMMKEDNVLVVAGCKSCFMYFMVVKQVQDCPKCTGQLIHFASP
ncbi:hypothetical protein Leryth_016365 [Lithospermum erythrorhizon]|nr:hypothetical protein Leryth_016365 [Lithospermum erythrorhizon]